MLKEFSINNFKSINKEVTLSMEADIERVSEHPFHLVDIRSNHLLRVCSMYGPNGGGKSNILKALNFLRKLVALGSSRDGIGDYSCVFSDSNICEFTAFFCTQKHDIGYVVRFSTFLNEVNIEDERFRIPGRTIVNIISESVYVLNDVTGNYDELCARDINGNILTNNKEIKTIINDRPIGSSMSILKFFYEYFYNENVSSSTSLDILFELYNEITSIIPLSDNLMFRNRVSLSDGENIVQNKKELIKLLDAADIHVSDIVVERNGVSTKIYFVRQVSINNKIIEKTIDLNEESLGTQKIFELMLRFIHYRNKSVIFLGDDINAYLHPKLLGAVIELFNSDANNKSQLIFNSHDITNMNNHLFRRDEIWFVYRDDSYQTNMIPLSNITNYKGKQIRNDASYGKQYLEGKYGADPFIEKGLNWNE